jgi:hypothetical protein
MAGGDNSDLYRPYPGTVKAAILNVSELKVGRRG